MAKYPSENTDALKYFRAFLTSWISKIGMNKTLAAKRLGVAQSQLNEILNAKRGASINIMEKICANMRVNIVDALEQGRRLCGEESTQEKFTIHQVEAIDAFKAVLLHGGELAEELTERAIAIARKKQAEADLQNPTPATQLSKSA